MSFLPDCALTATVNTKLAPELICDAEAFNIVTVAAMLCVTVTATADEYELELLVLPPYEAVIECVAAGRFAVTKIAMPLAFSGTVPRIGRSVQERHSARWNTAAGLRKNLRREGHALSRRDGRCRGDQRGAGSNHTWRCRNRDR